MLISTKEILSHIIETTPNFMDKFKNEIFEPKQLDIKVLKFRDTMSGEIKMKDDDRLYMEEQLAEIEADVEDRRAEAEWDRMQEKEDDLLFMSDEDYRDDEYYEDGEDGEAGYEPEYMGKMDFMKYIKLLSPMVRDDKPFWEFSEFEESELHIIDDRLEFKNDVEVDKESEEYHFFLEFLKPAVDYHLSKNPMVNEENKDDLTQKFNDAMRII
jgi:hypothetical protein